MPQGEPRTLYVLERDGRTVYCSSSAVASALLATGWTLADSGHRPMLVERLATDLPSRTPDDPV